MAGRAGRAGIDDAGEAILLATRDARLREYLFGLMRVRYSSTFLCLDFANWLAICLSSAAGQVPGACQLMGAHRVAMTPCLGGHWPCLVVSRHVLTLPP